MTPRIFSQLVIEATNNDNYMLGQHAARSGEKPRGFPVNSAYANLGFYKRDPADDIKREPGESVPKEVWSTIQTIVNSFIYIHKIGKQQEIFNLLIPYIQDFELFRKSIVRHNRLLEEIKMLRTRHEKLMEDLAENPGSEGLSKKISILMDSITKLEEEENFLAGEVERLDKELEEIRPELQEEIINTIVSLVEPAKEIVGDSKAVHEAFNRYTALVYGRRSDAQGGLGRSYLLLDPIVSFMRFYNNAMLTHKRRIDREEDKITQLASASKHGKSVLKGDNKLAMLNFMTNSIMDLVDIKRKSSDPTRVAQLTTYIHKAYDEIQKQLDLKTKVQLSSLLHNFLAGKPQSEGELKRFILTDIKPKLSTSIAPTEKKSIL